MWGALRPTSRPQSTSIRVFLKTCEVPHGSWASVHLSEPLAGPRLLLLQCRNRAGQAAAPAVTFTKDIAPIFQRACQNCHRPGSVAPMSLLTYEDARPWARSIKQRVSLRDMPPWFIYFNGRRPRIKDDPSLSDEEIAKVVKWVDSGAPGGNPADMPPPRQFRDADRWAIGQPDHVVSIPKEWIVKPAGADDSGRKSRSTRSVRKTATSRPLETKPSKLRGPPRHRLHAVAGRRSERRAF